MAVTGGVAAATLLAACSSTGASGGKPIKFWNMPWGNVKFTPLDKKITLGYKPSGSLPDATYQAVQWASFTTTFASAVASGTGPAVSSGSGTQAFQFSKQHHIAYADDLLDSWKKNGLYDDFLPGLLDTSPFPTTSTCACSGTASRCWSRRECSRPPIGSPT
jgi:multiple sugar transport system substrate-binding protein